MTNAVRKRFTAAACPWCSKRPKLKGAYSFLADGNKWRVTCVTLGCPVNPATLQCMSKGEAVAAWNRRAVR